MRLTGITVLSAAVSCACALAQTAQAQPGSDGPPAAAVNPNPSPVPLEWVPPALTALTAQAPIKSSFTLDRNMLSAAAGLMSDSDPEARQAINKLDGVSVHILRFGDAAVADPEEVAAIRDAYHLRGWKHLVSATKDGGPVHNGNTDVWVVLDGTNVRGAVVLAETPKSVTLVTVAGNLSPTDILHLRGHFGIPRFDAGGLTESNK